MNDGDTEDGQGGQKGWSGWAPYSCVCASLLQPVARPASLLTAAVCWAADGKNPEECGVVCLG